jgi:hypothetical protein
MRNGFKKREIRRKLPKMIQWIIHDLFLDELGSRYKKLKSVCCDLLMKTHTQQAVHSLLRFLFTRVVVVVGVCVAGGSFEHA